MSQLTSGHKAKPRPHAWAGWLARAISQGVMRAAGSTSTRTSTRTCSDAQTSLRISEHSVAELLAPCVKPQASAAPAFRSGRPWRPPRWGSRIKSWTASSPRSASGHPCGSGLNMERRRLRANAPHAYTRNVAVYMLTVLANCCRVLLFIASFLVRQRSACV